MMSKEAGRAFFLTCYGIAANIDPAAQKLTDNYDRSLRVVPQQPADQALNRQNKLLRAKLKELQDQ